MVFSKPADVGSSYETRNDLNVLARLHKHGAGGFKQYQTTRVYHGYKFKADGDNVYILNRDSIVVDRVEKSDDASAYNYATRNCNWGASNNCDIDIKTTYTFKKSKIGLIVPETSSSIIYK
ncbi:MAG: hypothetical protein ACRC3J_01890 [Culicoidibacterales bacterium]